MYAAGDVELASSVYSGLVRYKLGTVEVEPAIATEWTQNEDGTVWTFQLREGVQFHKGYGELTAEDVVFTLERLVDPELAAPNADTMGTFESAKALGPYELQITMSAPEPDMLGKLASPYLMIVSKKAVQELGEKFGQNPVGSGQFEFKSWSPGKEIRLSSFDEYWDGPSEVEQVAFIPIPDPTTLITAFDSGDIDMMQVTDAEQYAKYQSKKDVTLSAAPMLSVRHIQYGVDKPPFDNPLVREAINFAIDRKALMEGLFDGISVPADNFLPVGVNYRVDDLLQYEYNPDRARQLLAEAGYPDGLDVVLTVPNIGRFTQPATVIQQDLAKVGMNAEIKIMETQALASQAASGDNFQMWIQSHTLAPNPDVPVYSWFHSDGIPGTNWSHIDVPAIDEAITTAATTVDEEVRGAAFEDLQHLVADGNYGYYFDYEKYIWAMQDNVVGFESDPLRSLRLDNVTLKG